MEKQDLCEWISKAMKVALIPNNMKVGFCKSHEWHLALGSPGNDERHGYNGRFKDKPTIGQRGKACNCIGHSTLTGTRSVNSVGQGDDSSSNM